MRPSGEYILQAVASALITDYVPIMTADKAQAELGLFALLIGVVSEEMERGTARRVEENKELRGLFAEALSVVQNEDLKSRLSMAARSEETDYRVSALDRTNCELLHLLTELHAHVEDLEGEGARQVEEEIWKVLENWTKRREFATTEMFTQMLLSSAVEKALEKEAALSESVEETT
jgi:hypothetical protein